MRITSDGQTIYDAPIELKSQTQSWIKLRRAQTVCANLLWFEDPEHPNCHTRKQEGMQIQQPDLAFPI